MNKARIFFISLAFLILGTAFGQDNVANQNVLAKSSWAFGIGFDEPQLVGTTLYVNGWRGYGLYGSAERSFSENFSFRVLANYNKMVAEITPGGTIITNYSFSGNFDMLYYLIPCETVSPYFLIGLGDIYYQVRNSPKISNGWNNDYLLNIGVGAELHFASDWKLTGELGFHQVGTDKFDGMYAKNNGGGVFGGNFNSFMTMEFGAAYYFGIGGKSHLCDLCSGIKENYPTLQQIDSLITAHIPKEVIKEVVVEKPVEKEIEKPVEKPAKHMLPTTKKWVLSGVNFKTNKSELLPEAYPVLNQAVQTLKDNPDVKVQIQGHTDSVGKPKANQKLSEDRANAVKDYLVHAGIDESRLTSVGYGAKFPVAENTTEIGRAQNRRIEFKVIK